NGDRLPAVIEEIAAERAASSQPLLAGTVVISTCNRLEVYLDTERFHDAVDVVTEAVSRTSGLDREVVSLCLEAAMDTPVPHHLDAPRPVPARLPLRQARGHPGAGGGGRTLGCRRGAGPRRGRVGRFRRPHRADRRHRCLCPTGRG